ncbi:guanine nucleotide-binding protein alpha-3 subunit [Ilyonectria robusta]
MADPITLLSTAGAVANSIDALGKTINTIGELQSQFQDADPAVLNLDSQLVALNTALNDINVWAESTPEEPHHQVVMDLDRCVACCRMLINKIDAEMASFQITPGNELDVASKFRLLLNGKDFENIQRMIGQQTEAFTLLLTACNTTTPPEQKGILEQPQARSIFTKMESDCESLNVDRDVDPPKTPTTPDTAASINSPTWSMPLPFSTNFISRIYQGWVTGPPETNLQEHRSETSSPPRPSPRPWSITSLESNKRSQAIDRLLEEDATRPGRECQVLLLGSDSRRDILEMMKLTHLKGRSEDDLHNDRLTVLKHICDSAKALVNAMRQLEVAPESDKIWEDADFIVTYVYDSSSTSTGLDPRFRVAMEKILESPYYPGLMGRCTEFYLPHSAEYFFSEIGRISLPNYLPTEIDLLRARNKTNGVSETWLQTDQLSICMIDVGGQRGERKKWMQYFENITSIVFVVDLDSYDETVLDETLEETSQTIMMESLVLFEAVVNSPSFSRTSIILLLNNTAEFEQKLAKDPLSNYFPEYSGGNDVNGAAKYLLWRFNQVNRAQLAFYPHMVHPGTTSATPLVLAAIKETLLNNALRHF